MSDTTTTKTECWCTYGREGREFTHPGCPEHDPNGPKPYQRPADFECDICADGEEECTSCDGNGEDDGGYDCGTCYGSGYAIPDHCCDCGGSPYCQCCRSCGSPNAGTCNCPITVQRSDGTTRTI